MTCKAPAALPIQSVVTVTSHATTSALLIWSLLTGGSRIASAQDQAEHQARAATALIYVGGVNMSSRCESCLSWRRANTQSRKDRSLFLVDGSRSSHVLFGLIGGLIVGVATGAIIGNNNAKRCHAESCQVSAALGGGGDILVGGLAGSLAGAVVGAIWPVSK
jgi:hypothetical protein